MLFSILETKRRDFDEATEALCNDASVIDSKIILLTDIIYDVCFSVCGKTVRVKGSQSKNVNLLFGLIRTVRAVKVHF